MHDRNDEDVRATQFIDKPPRVDGHFSHRVRVDFRNHTSNARRGMQIGCPSQNVTQTDFALTEE